MHNKTFLLSTKLEQSSPDCSSILKNFIQHMNENFEGFHQQFLAQNRPCAVQIEINLFNFFNAALLFLKKKDFNYYLCLNT